MIIEKVRTKEAEQILYNLLSAQKRFKIDNTTYADFIVNLDVGFNSTQNFNTPGWNPAQVEPFGKIARNDGSYALYISENATITCNEANCQKLGYSSESSPW